MATSIELASAVATAFGLADETVQLHLKTIRAAGAITFKGYGRSAAAMTPLDAARLIIAVAGSTFAKDSVTVLTRFSKLEPLSEKGGSARLEDFLANHIDTIRYRGDFSQPWEIDPSAWPRSNLAGAASLKLIWVGGQIEAFPRVAVVRWFRKDGRSDAATFASERLPLPFIDEARLARLRPEAGVIHARTVTARALAGVARAL